MICSFCFKQFFPASFCGILFGSLGPWSLAPDLWLRPALRFHGCGATSLPAWSSANSFPLLRQKKHTSGRFLQVVDRNFHQKIWTRMMIFGKKKHRHVSGFLPRKIHVFHLIDPVPLSPLLAMVLCKIIRPAAFSVSKFLLKQLRASLNKPSQPPGQNNTTFLQELEPFLPLIHAELLDFNRRPLSRLSDGRFGDCFGAQGPLHWSFAATETHFSTTRVVHPNTRSHDHHAPVARSHFTTQGPPRQRSSTQMALSRLAALSTKKNEEQIYSLLLSVLGLV